MQLLHLLHLMLQLHTLTYTAAALDFNIAVVSQSSLINSQIVADTFTRRVNSNWRLLPHHSLTPVFVHISDCAATDAVANICSITNLTAIIGIGDCSLLSHLNALSESLTVPFMAIPTGLCPSPIVSGSSSISISHSTDDFAAAAAAAFAHKRADTVAVFYDSQQSSSTVQLVTQHLSKQGVSTLTLQCDSANGSVSSDLTSVMQRLLKKSIYNSLIIAQPNTALSLLQHAAAASVLQQNYFWLLLDTGITPAALLNVTPANANVGLLRGAAAAAPAAPGVACSSAVADVYGQCSFYGLATLQLRWMAAVESVAAALNQSLANSAFHVTNATCGVAAAGVGGGAAAWPAGSLVANGIVTLNNFNSGGGTVSFNATSRQFVGEGLEFIASFNELPTSATQFIRSAKYNTTIAAFSPLFSRRSVSTAFPNTFLGFKNQTIVVCSPPVPPFNTHLMLYPNRTAILGGMVADILHALSEKMEFRYRAKTPDDDQWGSPQANSQYYTGCVGEVQRGTVLLGAGPFTKSTVRDKVIDFTFDIFEEANAVLVPKPAPESPMWNVFTPFSIGVWLLLIAACFVAAASTWLLAKCSPFTAYNLELDYAIADEVWLQEYVWSIFGSYLQQGQDFYPFAMSPRVVLAFWWLFTVVMLGTYTGDLTAHLTITITNLPIKTLDDLTSQSAIKPVVIKGTNLQPLFESATTGVYKKIKDSMILVDTVAQCSAAVFEGDKACLTDRTYLLNLALTNCTQVYLADESFNTATISFVMQDDAYFAELINFNLQKMQETGLMQQLFRKHWYGNTICTDTSNNAEADPIAIEGIAGSLIIVGVLYVTGIFILLLELLWIKGFKKSPLDLPMF